MTEIITNEMVEAPPVCLQMIAGEKISSIATLGNFSLIIGKAKSRKTFLITIALAAATRNDTILGRFKGVLPGSQNVVLYFDTEQSKFHAHRTVNRVCSLAGYDYPVNFIGYGLRKYKPVDRLKLIKAAIYNTQGLAFVVIDGIRDLVTSINDEEQATSITSHLLQWTEEQNIHIVVVLHQNKNDVNARGHLGSELTNKAETVLSVTKDEKDKNISIVEAEYCRDIEPEPFAFEIDENGLPRIVEHWELKTSHKASPAKLTASEIPDEAHQGILNKVFSHAPKQLYKMLLTNIKLELNCYGVKKGDNQVRDFIQYYENKGWIGKDESSNAKNRFYEHKSKIPF